MPKLTFYSEISDPQTSPERLFELAGLHLEYAIGIAQNVRTPPQILEALSHRPEKGIRRSLTRNPNTPQDLLYKLARGFPQEFLNNPILSMFHLENPNFANDIPETTLKMLVKHSSAPYFLINQALKKSKRPMQLALRSNAVAMRDSDKVRKIGDADLAGMEKHYDQSYNKKSFSEIISIVQKVLDQNAIYLRSWNTVSVGFSKKFDLSECELSKKELEMLRVLQSRMSVEQYQNCNLDKMLDLRPRFTPRGKMPVYGTSQIVENLSSLDKLKHILSRKLDYLSKVYGNRKIDIQYIYEVVSDKNSTSDRLESILKDGIENIKQLIEKEQYPWRYSVVKSLWVDIRRMIAMHPNVDTALFVVLSQDPQPAVRKEVARNPNTPRDLLERVFKHRHPRVRAALCDNPALPLDLLEYLENDPHTYVRAKVAACEHAPITMLERLFIQTSPRIKRGLCQNLNTPRVLLERLRENATIDMQALLDANPSAQGIHTVFTELHDSNTSKARLLELWDFAELRVLVAQHPNAPLERIAAHFASSHQPLMRYIALRSPFLPRASLNLFVRSCMWQERLAVSMHPNVSYRQLSVLAHDAHSLIRAVASNRLEIEHTLK